jgi:thymidylate synthase
MPSFNYLIAETATDAFTQAYEVVNDFGEVVESRIGRTKHLTDVTIKIENPYQNVVLSMERNLSLRYMLGEIDWYLSGSNKVADIAKYAKMWNDLTDDGETVNSAYGYRIFTKFGFDQLQYCIDKLKKNPYDRQAVIHIKDASNAPTKDTPCTCLLQFTCSNGKLNLHTYMRSNDIWLGLPYDVAFFTCLMHLVSKHTEIPVGAYYHTVGDLHLYERHWNKGISAGWEYEASVGEGWNFAEETYDSIHEMLDGKMPTNPLLKCLYKINKAVKGNG